MRKFKWMYPVITLLAIAASSSVWAHGRSHSHFSIGLGYYGPAFYGNYGYGYGGYGYGRYGFGGYGYGYPYYYNPPVYAYPPTVIVPATPPVYIQRQEVQPTQPVRPQTNYWYYCRNPDGYYPYIRNCPGGWLQVAPQPPGR